MVSSRNDLPAIVDRSTEVGADALELPSGGCGMKLASAPRVASPAMPSETLDELVVQTLDSAACGRTSALCLYGPRGAGKSWWLNRVADAAAQRTMTVTRARADSRDREVAFGALSALLAPWREMLDDAAWSTLKPIVTLDHRRVDAVDVKLTTFQFLCTLAEQQPLCIILDDLQWFDAATIEVIEFAARRTSRDAIAFVSASTDSATTIATSATTSARIEPASTTVLSQMLITSGLDEAAARRCAEAANGNPGIAQALAAGLTDRQRSGSDPISVIPRPSGEMVDELQTMLRSFGEVVCRSLVVAAAEDGGGTAAVRAALATLGEPTSGLDDAESLGVIDIVGGQFAFTNPWVRTVAYHLVAPSSRRAAHRALAAWFAKPEQAAQRAWHLAAAAEGPSQPVAEALELVAADAARRGGIASAAITAQRAAEFATTPQHRQRNLLAALRWWIDATSTEGVRQVLKSLDPIDLESAVARAEAIEFLSGGVVAVQWDATSSQPTGATEAGSWAQARSHRLAVAAALERGDHRAARRALDANRSLGEARHALANSVALRHAGETRGARDASTEAGALFAHSDAFEARVALLVAVDLDILQGRGNDALAALDAAPQLPPALHDRAESLAARARLQCDPSRSPTSEPLAFTTQGDGPLLAVRAAIQAGVMNGDIASLMTAVETAEKHRLPIEAGEARLWLSELQPAADRSTTITLCRAGLQRCGVRAWDQRLSQAAPVVQPARPRGQVDPGLDALSQAEFRVAEAVARGLTNRDAAAALIISVKTVDFHLQQIYRKLGIRSRTELAVRVATSNQRHEEFPND